MLFRRFVIPDGVDRNMVTLSQRGQTVLALLGLGQPNKAIACQLNLKVGTVDGYVSELILGLGVNNRTQASRWFWINEAKVLKGIPADIGFAAERAPTT